MKPEQARELLQRVSKALGAQGKVTRLLDAIAWSEKVEVEFFAKGAKELPRVTYEIDRDLINDRIEQLAVLEASLAGEHEVLGWLRSTVHSFIDGNRLLLSLGTREFYETSRELYGGARTRFPGVAARNIDLADHLLERLHAEDGTDLAHDEDPERIDAELFARALRQRLHERQAALEVDVVVDEHCSAKVIAGMSRVRVRADAQFPPWDVAALFSHEIETHALTAQNGALQRDASFLRGGGPRTTRTQEGLATVAELFSGALSAERLERLALRVKLVELAEQGANFLDLYRFLLEHGSEQRDAYLDAQRICRGGRVEGGAPFTKDACYVAGMLHVYAFLSVVVRGGLRDEAEMLACGRIDLDDMPALAALRNLGVLERPRFLPSWLHSWRTLLPHFAVASFFNGLSLRAVEDRYRSLLLRAKDRPEA